jgi:hypothetical protein
MVSPVPTACILIKVRTTIAMSIIMISMGYVMHAKIAGAESVKCHLSTVLKNDTHIHLGLSGIGNLCNSVTAELSPHFRPIEYSRFHYAENVNKLKTRPIRIMAICSSMRATSRV